MREIFITRRPAKPVSTSLERTKAPPRQLPPRGAINSRPRRHHGRQAVSSEDHRTIPGPAPSDGGLWMRDSRLLRFVDWLWILLLLATLVHGLVHGLSARAVVATPITILFLVISKWSQRRAQRL